MPPKKGKLAIQKISPEELKDAINKRLGEGTMRMASDPSLQIERIPCGILSVDALIGGGFARNRHTEIFGSANVGKSYLAQRLIASAQSLGGMAAWVDAERTFDPLFAEACGINLDDLAYHEQEHGPKCVNFMELLLRSGLYDVIVLDSISALLPLYEYENEMGAGSMGMEQAKLMSAALRKLTAANKKTALVFINQTRDAVGVMFGKKSTTSGGRAMGFYAGLRLELVRTESLKRKGRVVDHKTGEIKKDSDIVYGHRVLVRSVKDKTGSVAHPQAETTFVFDYETSSHDHIEDLIYLGRVYEFIEKKGDRWHVVGYEDEQQHGRPRFKKWLKKNPLVQEDLEEWISEAIVGSDNEEDDG